MVFSLAGCDNQNGDRGFTTDPQGIPSVSIASGSTTSTSSTATPVPTATPTASAKADTAIPKYAKMISQKAALPGAADHDPTPSTRKKVLPECPPDMVKVDKFCVDRYESVIFSNGQRVSPFYPPSQHHSSMLFNLWKTKFSHHSTSKGLSMPIPQPDAWQLTGPFEMAAVSKSGVTPNGHANRRMGEEACYGAGKRLCKSEEWLKACKGENGTKFPYGDTYREGICNVFRSVHPLEILHTEGHSGMNDPRLNMTQDENGVPLLQKTGSYPDCASKWGDDAIYDMVGNLDEWMDEPEGIFRGGFYARSTREGCDMGISVHPASYFDYSTGFRCCRDALIKIIKTPEEDPYKGLHED